MSRILNLPDRAPRLIAPTTTKKIAQRMLSASAQVADAMPRGFHVPAALDIMLALYVAEDDARYLTVEDLPVPGAPSLELTRRWVDALIAQGLVDRRGGLHALSTAGHTLVDTIIERLYVAQRALD
ncbi:hypothetical protein [Sphingomonas rubra]|uniref:Uncharacterized protein n=1 Tax=Sphingomonas rubra TaxID=634430 RepID=A0A1I5RQ06_9SPHN|nr:hypothetical protein [Sphingomonas rubra]SFP60598.1 hypothetical protein SAMN04488241_10438 [Sphingomonas rubra]